MAKAKTLNLKIGDVLILRRPTGEAITKGKNKGMNLTNDSEWDVVDVKKKSVTLQNYPTYEIRKIKR